MSEDSRIKEIQGLKPEMKKPLLKTMGLFDEPSNMMSIEPQNIKLSDLPPSKPDSHDIILALKKENFYLADGELMRIDFIREVFAGRKKLLKLSKIQEAWEAPKFKEISAKRIWADIKKEADRMKYYRPSKKCLFTVKF